MFDPVEELEGTILGVQHTPMSGLATMIMDCGAYHCDAGPLFRSLHSAFGEQGPIGKAISFSVDAMGGMCGFDPVEEGDEDADRDRVEAGA